MQEDIIFLDKKINTSLCLELLDYNFDFERNSALSINREKINSQINLLLKKSLTIFGVKIL
jgi:hypothetical protein